MSNELGKMRKEAIVAFLNILSQHSPGGNEENHGSPCPARDSSWVPYKYKVEALELEQACSVAVG
jgi:hypothetical protein